MPKKLTTTSVKRATVITAASKYSTVLFNLIFLMVLARLVAPEEFGVVSVTTVFVTFFTLLSDVGLSAGIVQEKSLTQDDLVGIYSVNWYISIAISAAFLPFSYALAWFYGDAIYIPLGAVLAVSLLFTSLTTIPEALFMRDKRFMLVGAARVIAVVVGGVAAVLLALRGLGSYAIAGQTLVTGLVTFIWLDILCRREFGMRFRLRPQMRGLRKILAFSANQFGFTMVNYFARNLDNILIGKFMGAASLGYYDKAYRLTTYPNNFLTAVIAKALHPILSDHQDDSAYIYDRYVRVAKFLSLAGAFIGAVFFFAAGELVLLLFGDAWGASVEPFRALSVSVWFQMTVSSAGAIYQSMGRTDVMFRSCLVFVPIQLACIVAGVFSGSLANCAVWVAASFVLKFFVDYWFLIVKCFGKSFRSFMALFIPDVVIAIAVSVVEAALVALGVFAQMPIVLSLACKVVVAVIVYGVAAVITGQAGYVVDVLPTAMARKVRRALHLERFERGQSR